MRKATRDGLWPVGGRLSGTISPLERIFAGWMPHAKPAGLRKETFATCCGVSPAELVPKITRCAPPPRYEPAQLLMTSEASADHTSALLLRKRTTEDVFEGMARSLVIESC